MRLNTRHSQGRSPVPLSYYHTPVWVKNQELLIRFINIALRISPPYSPFDMPAPYPAVWFYGITRLPFD